jgi:acyl-CoA thioester hydrolase
MSDFRTDIQVRFADTDALGHLNNTAYALYVEQARLEFFRQFGATTRGLILAQLALDFRRQARFGDEVHVLTRVGKVGRTSVQLVQDVYAESELAAETRSVVVVFDYQTNKPAPIGDETRCRLEAYLIPA